MVIAHSNRREPDTESGPAFPDTIVLHCRRDEPPLHIAAASGRTYHIIACDAPACSRLVQETLRSSQAELLPRSGGLLSNLSVLENIAMPVVYHGRVIRRQLTQLVYDAAIISI